MKWIENNPEMWIHPQYASSGCSGNGDVIWKEESLVIWNAI